MRKRRRFSSSLFFFAVAAPPLLPSLLLLLPSELCYRPGEAPTRAPAGSHASQGSPPQSLQSVPRSHLTSRVGEVSSRGSKEEEEEE